MRKILLTIALLSFSSVICMYDPAAVQEIEEQIEQFKKAALLLAVQQNNLHATNQVIGIGADVNAQYEDLQNRTPLMIAAKNGFDQMVQNLVELHGANVNLIDDKGNTALHLAAATNNADIIAFLLQHDAHTDIMNEAEHTPLLSALFSEEPGLESAQAFFDNNIPLDEEIPALQWTPLMFAAREAKPQVVQWLLAHGVQADHQNAEGKTALHVLAEFAQDWLPDGQEDINQIAQALANATIIDLQTTNGKTALMITVQQINLPLVKKLLELGANTELMNQQGNTALQIAQNLLESVEGPALEQLNQIILLLLPAAAAAQE